MIEKLAKTMESVGKTTEKQSDNKFDPDKRVNFEQDKGDKKFEDKGFDPDKRIEVPGVEANANVATEGVDKTKLLEKAVDNYTNDVKAGATCPETVKDIKMKASQLKEVPENVYKADRTYALFRNEAGDWRELIPFTPFTSVDPGDMIPVQIQVRGAWADFLIAGDFVDAFRVGNSDGNIGLFAQPIGTDPATIDFRRLSVSVSPQPVAAEAAPGGGVPDDLSRSLRMLYLKGRIPSVEGRFYPIEGKTLTLANMGYFDQAMFDHHAFDAMVQAKIKFKSAYDHPDFPH